MGQVAETESTLALAENVYVNLPTPLAYYITELITTVKSFVVQVPENVASSTFKMLMQNKKKSTK